MTLPDEDVAARGRSIFERLRAEQEAAAAPPPAPLEQPIYQWSALTEVGADAPAAEGDRDQPATTPVGDAPAAVDEATAERSSESDDQPNADDDVVSSAADLASAMSPPAGDGSAGMDQPPETVDTERPPQAEQAVEPTPSPGPPTVQTVTTPAPVAPAAPPTPRAYVPTPPVMPDLPPVAAPSEATAEPAMAGSTRPGQDEAPERPSFARPLPRILAVANQKGGVGKTTTTVNLGASLAVLGYRVLVVDLDPQGNATTGLGINSRNLEHSIYDVILHDVSLDDCVEPTTLKNLFVAPATIDLAGAEIELVPAFSRELRLRRALEEVRDDYDFVLIDCPPSLGLLTVNGLAAATEVLVPIQCEYYALEGLGQLLRNVNLVQSNLNPKLEVSAIVLTMYDARTKLAEQVADEVRAHFGPKVCRNVVPRTVRLSEAPSFGQPIIVFDPSSRGALAYRELAKEVSGGAPQRAG